MVEHVQKIDEHGESHGNSANDSVQSGHDYVVMELGVACKDQTGGEPRYIVQW